jgi:lipopolysaccharide export system protein LptA
MSAGVTAALCLAAVQALAANPPPVAQPQASQPAGHDQGPLEVTSDHDLEWLQQDRAYIARGNAVAKRGTVTLTGDTLIAYYRPLNNPTPPPPAATPPTATVAGATPDGASPKSGFDTGNTDIWRVVALGHAHIMSEGREAFGDRMEYDKDMSVVVLTGQALKGVTPTETVTARDALEYWLDKQMAVARGDALITKLNGDTLAGDLIGAHFLKDAAGHTALKTIDAKGHVVITTATDIVHGDTGTYDLDTKRTVLFGNVRANRGTSELEGESAEVNMDTGVSQVFPGPGQRVRGLFVPQRDQKPAAAAPGPASGQAAGAKK